MGKAKWGLDSHVWVWDRTLAAQPACRLDWPIKSSPARYTHRRGATVSPSIGAAKEVSAVMLGGGRGGTRRGAGRGGTVRHWLRRGEEGGVAQL